MQKPSAPLGELSTARRACGKSRDMCRSIECICSRARRGHLDCDSAEETLRAGIRDARSAEWDKRRSLSAVVRIDADADALNQLNTEGRRVASAHWVDTDNSFCKRRGGGPSWLLRHKA